MAPASVATQRPLPVPEFSVPDLGPQALVNQHFEQARSEAARLQVLRAAAKQPLLLRLACRIPSLATCEITHEPFTHYIIISVLSDVYLIHAWCMCENWVNNTEVSQIRLAYWMVTVLQRQASSGQDCEAVFSIIQRNPYCAWQILYVMQK